MQETSFSGVEHAVEQEMRGICMKSTSRDREYVLRTTNSSLMPQSKKRQENKCKIM